MKPTSTKVQHFQTQRKVKNGTTHARQAFSGCRYVPVTDERRVRFPHAPPPIKNPQKADIALSEDFLFENKMEKPRSKSEIS
jgi:hypothetical protein